jgi:hypothetical protein
MSGLNCLEPELWDAQQHVAWLMPRRSQAPKKKRRQCWPRPLHLVLWPQFSFRDAGGTMGQIGKFRNYSI